MRECVLHMRAMATSLLEWPKGYQKFHYSRINQRKGRLKRGLTCSESDSLVEDLSEIVRKVGRLTSFKLLIINYLT